MTKLTLDFQRMWHNMGSYDTFEYEGRRLTITLLDVGGFLKFFNKFTLLKMVLFGRKKIVGLVFEEV